MHVIRDNFFKNPDKILDWANSLEYVENNNNYPGRRTEELHEVDPEFYHQTVQKIMMLLTDKGYEYNISMHFQKVPEVWGDGVIHSDGHYNAIIYFNKNDNAGTSLYRIKDRYGYNPPNYGIIREGFESDNPNKVNIEKEKIRDTFEKTLDVKGLYNRLFLFDGCEFHGANSFKLENSKENEERLILVMFFHKIAYKDLSPDAKLAGTYI